MLMVCQCSVELHTKVGRYYLAGKSPNIDVHTIILVLPPDCSDETLPTLSWLHII